VADTTNDPDRAGVEDPNGEGVIERTLGGFGVTDDGLAWLRLISLVVYVGLGGTGARGFESGAVDPAVLGVYVTIVAVATTWVFGKQAVKTWRSGGGRS
jgi:hypothetical protein